MNFELRGFGIILGASFTFATPTLAQIQDQKIQRIEKILSERMASADPITIIGLSDAIVEESTKIGVEPELVLGIIHVESRFDPNAISYMNCRGMMQLMPATMSWWVETFGYEFPDPDIFYPIDNVRIATRYLGYLLVLFGGDVQLSLMAYNAGPSKVRRWIEKGHLPRQVRDYSRLVLKAADGFKGTQMTRS